MKGEHMAEDFLAMNPYHTVPTIKHGDFCLHEGNTILRYLTRAFPTAAGKFYGSGDTQKQAIIDCAMDKRLGQVYGLVSPLLYAYLGFVPKPDEETIKKVRTHTTPPYHHPAGATVQPPMISGRPPITSYSSSTRVHRTQPPPDGRVLSPWARALFVLSCACTVWRGAAGGPHYVRRPLSEGRHLRGR